MPSLDPEERSIPFFKGKGTHRRILTDRPVLLFSPGYYTYLTLHNLSVPFLHDCPLFIKPSIKILGYDCFFRSSFLYEDFRVT